MRKKLANIYIGRADELEAVSKPSGVREIRKSISKRPFPFQSIYGMFGSKRVFTTNGSVLRIY
jgi:hypothetical protein